MKTFFILFKEKQKKALTQDLLMGHVAYLKQLYASGNLMLCGPLADDSRALWILRAQDVDHAKQFIKDDPFVQQSYYRSFEITEFYSASPDNNWLMDQPQTEKNLDT